MPAQLDHLILAVDDAKKSLDFYTRVLGFTHEGERPPFSTVRVTPDFVLQLAPWGTRGGEHLAFAMTRAEFEEAFRRIREAGIEYGDTFESAANMRGPGESDGARGATRSLYLFDPSKHLIEIIYYP
jgi:catechol 2,3-dioxygenase-like lactoylglutathione lyase family enzyme